MVDVQAFLLKRRSLVAGFLNRQDTVARLASPVPLALLLTAIVACGETKANPTPLGDASADVTSAPSARDAGDNQASLAAKTAQVVVSNGHICMTRAGKVWCWGDDKAGQTGQATAAPAWTRPVRVQLSGLTDVIQLAVSDEHTCALRAEPVAGSAGGIVGCWGANGAMQSAAISAPAKTCRTTLTHAGEVDVPCQPTPTPVMGITSAIGLALADSRSCALLADGTISCWGQTRAIPVGESDVRAFAVGSQSSCVVRSGGQLHCTGSQPWTIQEWTEVRQVVMSTRTDLACVLHTDGRVACWGLNANGERGIGHTDPNIPLPGDPPAFDRGSEIAVGWSHVCARTAEGEVHCWGRNTYGALGLPVSASESCRGGPCLMRPRKVEGLPPAKAIGAGGASTCAITTDNRLFCWGALAGDETEGRPTYVPGSWEEP
jgi:alpha-tubulin suppressor-like RCC1 family protein